MPTGEATRSSSFGVMAELFTGLGHEVVVLTTGLPDAREGIVTDGPVEVHHLRGTPNGVTSAAYWEASAAAFDHLHALAPFDLVFGRGSSTWGYLSQSSYSGKVPLIQHEGTYPRWLHRLERNFPRFGAMIGLPIAGLLAGKNRIYRNCLLSADRVVCNSPALAEALRRINWWNPPKTEFIPYGLDLVPYKEARPTVIGNGPLRIVMVGRLARNKGVIDMVDIVAKLRDTSAVLEAIGPASAPMLAEIETRIRQRGVEGRVQLPGPEKNTRLPARIAGAAAFLFPSTHPEGLSKAVMEAMAAGLPVVAYDMPGIRVLVDHGVTGFVVPSRSVRRAADCLDMLLMDPALRARMGAAGQKRIETEFRPEVVEAQWQVLLSEVVGALHSDRRK